MKRLYVLRVETLSAGSGPHTPLQASSRWMPPVRLASKRQHGLRAGSQNPQPQPSCGAKFPNLGRIRSKLFLNQMLLGIEPNELERVSSFGKPADLRIELI